MTESQIRALRWIRDFEHTQSAWNRDMSAITQKGAQGSITISVEDWDALRPCFEPDPDFSSKRIWRLTEAGHAALRAAS